MFSDTVFADYLRRVDEMGCQRDYPIMKLIADGNGRLACKELFTPRKPSSAEQQADGSIRIVELVEKEFRWCVPVRTKEGFLIALNLFKLGLPQPRESVLWA